MTIIGKAMLKVKKMVNDNVQIKFGSFVYTQLLNQGVSWYVMP